MRLSFTGKTRIIIILLFAVSMVQGLVVLSLVNNSTDPATLKMDIQNTILITIFFQFLLVIILMIYIPIFLHKAFADIHQILKDITKGMYNVELDMEYFKSNVDREFLLIIESIRQMLKSIVTFDKLKKDKIVEHHNRILALLNLAENGIIILDDNGNIVYINDRLTDAFKSLSEQTNLMETNYPPEVENNLKKYISTLLKTRTKQDNLQYFIPSLKRHIALHSARVRDADGVMRGAVVSVSNLEKKKSDKVKEEKQSSNENSI